jgi:hypothetical protein
MNINLSTIRKPGQRLILPLLLTSVLLFACSATGRIPIIGAATPMASTPEGNIPVSTENSGNETPVPQVSNPSSTLDCQAVGDAFMDLEASYPILGLIGNGASTDANTPGSPLYINFTKLRSDYDILARLPDSPEFGKTGPAITQFQQLTDLVENKLKAAATPTSDGSSGDNPGDLYAKLAQPYIAVADAFSTSCPNYNPPTVPSTP